MIEANLRIYRKIATGVTGAFMAPADVAGLIGEIDRLRKAVAILRSELEEVVEFAVVERAALRQQEIDSILLAIANAEAA